MVSASARHWASGDSLSKMYLAMWENYTARLSGLVMSIQRSRSASTAAESGRKAT
jgi:hypothetical protein